MTKTHKELIFCFSLCFALFFFSAQPVFSTDLEIEYPKLQTGSQITSETQLPEYLKYVFDFGIFLGFFIVFLSLAFAGVLYLISPAAPGALNIAKDRVSGAISGLLILVLLYLIITTINPSLRLFKLAELEEIPPAPPATKEPGVYVHNPNNCPDDSDPYTASTPDLGLLKNRVNSVEIVQGDDNYSKYIGVLYDVTDFWGKCQYINPNTGCQELTRPFPASLSVYRYDFNPNGNGVYFYRKSFFDDSGGYLFVPNGDIKPKNGDSTLFKFSELRFTGTSKDYDNIDACTVPKAEQDCILWNPNNTCAQRQCPSLAGENITSMKIDGNYFVLLLYYNPAEDDEVDAEGPWNFCQAFPTSIDINRSGPQQIKWENIRNIGKLPNYAFIFPVQSK